MAPAAVTKANGVAVGKKKEPEIRPRLSSRGRDGEKPLKVEEDLLNPNNVAKDNGLKL